MSKQILSESFGFISAPETDEDALWQARFVAEVEAETVRGMVLNIASFIDELLIKLLLNFFPNSKKAEKLLSTLDGCINTIMDRANIAHALALIKDDEFESIKIVAKIRNEFAHKWEASFESKNISNLVGKFPKKYFEYLDGTPKAKFNFICSQLIQELLERARYASRINKILPKEYKSIFDLPIDERQRLLNTR